MQTIGYALIELTSGSIVQSFDLSLPIRVDLENSVSFISEVGQVIPDAGAPTHILVEKVSEPSPGYDYTPAGSSEAYDGSKVIVTRMWVAPPPYIPEAVTPSQARMALLQAGLLDDLTAIMSNPETPQAAKITWEYATVWMRDSAFIISLGQVLGLTETDIDNLFITASKIE